MTRKMKMPKNLRMMRMNLILDQNAENKENAEILGEC